MKVSKAKVGENRSAILAAAGRLFRERGCAAVSVSDVMTAAGLTHGAFYGYFRSKEDLVAATLAELMNAPRPPGAWSESRTRYLSPAHRDDGAGGCPVAALAGEAGRASLPARKALAEGVEHMIARQNLDAPGENGAERRRAAIGRVSAMVGALILSRAIGDGALSEEVLTATRDWLEEHRDAATLDE
jgi:TetR/AcrR family transcriptional repressor of nem operon